MDAQVLKAQQWVNATYTGVSGYNPCSEDGITGWGTIHSLTRGLQHELGMTALSDSFGPTTLAKLTALGDITPATTQLNIKIIVEAALFCKGYSGGELDGSFSSLTTNGLALLQLDMGFAAGSVPASHANPKVVKALLTMDAYVTLTSGSDVIQTIQRWMNRTFTGRRDFFIVPCDGIFSRAVQQALTMALQFSMGMADGVADGIFGSATIAGLKADALVATGSTDSGSTHFVRLFKAALAFNRRDPDWDVDAFTTATAKTTQEFQSFSLLPVTGKGDYQTWASLLVSTGDPTRAGTAADCRTVLNVDRLQALAASGRLTVGRYLTGAADKALTVSEVGLIVAAGLSFFPIYQLAGNLLTYFSYELGRTAGAQACSAAQGFGIPRGAVIYVAVDYDATGDEITSNIIPHFQGVQDAFLDAGGRYTVGVYGTRNVCSQVSAAGLALRSFVSGMSTGYSGNLGFPLPTNWAFDQIKTITIAPGQSGELQIDNDINSGRDPGVSTLTEPVDLNEPFYAYIEWLEARTLEWWTSGNTSNYPPDLLAQYLRSFGSYSNPDFNHEAGSIDSDFVDYVNARGDLPSATPPSYHDPFFNLDGDPAHFGIVHNAYFKHGTTSNRKSVGVEDILGWAGDLLTAACDFIKSGRPNDEAYEYSFSRIGSASGQFSGGDLAADMDAYLYATQARNSNFVQESRFFRRDYASKAASKNRIVQFYSVRFSGSESTLRASADAAFFLKTDPDVLTLRLGVFATQLLNEEVESYTDIFHDTARAFSDLVMSWI